MGEAKRRREQIQEAAHDLGKALVDRGLLIEGGFVAFRKLVMHPDAPDDQVREMKLAFFAGADHLFASIMNIMDEDAEPTEADLARMDQIKAELDAFRGVLEGRVAESMKTQGNA